MNKLLTFYHSVLPALGLEVDASGALSHPSLEADVKQPFLIEDKRVYLPNNGERMDWSKQIVFHPLCESIARGRSEMLTALLGSLNYKMWNVASYLLVQVATIASKQDTTEMKRISPKLADFLSNIRDITPATIQWITKLVALAIQGDDDKFLIRFYLKHGGIHKGTNYTRICTVYSPFREELERCSVLSASTSGKTPVWGIEPPRKKDVDIVLSLFNSIFPGFENDEYTQGSSAETAPYFSALVESIAALLKDVNKLALNLKGHYNEESEVGYIFTDLAWYNNLPDFNSIRKLVPMMAYNEGVAREPEHSKEASRGNREKLVETSDNRPLEREATLKTRSAISSAERLPAATGLLGRTGNRVRLEAAYDPVVERNRVEPDRGYRSIPRDDDRRSSYRDYDDRDRDRDYDRRYEDDRRDFRRDDQYVARAARGSSYRGRDSRDDYNPRDVMARRRYEEDRDYRRDDRDYRGRSWKTARH